MAPRPVNARATALQLIEAVLRDGQPLDEAWASAKALARLEPRDRAFARVLAATVLRRLGQLDALIDGCMDRPLKPKLDRLRGVLRLGAAQIAFLGTPTHAAVNSSVDLAVASRLGTFKGLVNAVLRRVAREGEALVAGQDAARLNTPAWLWESWVACHGEAVARAIAEAHLADPPLDLTLKLSEDVETWAARLGAIALPGGGLRLGPGQGDVAGLAGFAEGAWWVQDFAASLPAKLLGPVAGLRVADLCAAPGGKTMQLAAAGAAVTAVDLSRRRLERVSENLARTNLAAELIRADATEWRPKEPFDAVLLDAACSATGTLRRHPDIAHLKQPADLVALTELQDRLLANAIQMVKPGGLLVYATCSLQLEEGVERMAKLLTADGALSRRPIEPAEIGGAAEAVTEKGDLRTLPSFWPDRGGMDGFYACRLTRA
jgi:16S rRNA (cytosine967-C5)-methyltransferase